MITVYGATRSRASRVLWMLEECGVPYKQDDLSQYTTMDEKGATMRKIYPLGKVPVLRDGDLQLAESMAINLYLARKYGKDLWPDNEGDQAKAEQWSFFAVTEIDPPMVQLMLERTFRKEPDRNAENEKKNAEQIRRPLAYLEGYLAEHPWLVANRFTVADLNLASIFTVLKPAKLELGEYPNIRAWVERCHGRPAFGRVGKS